MITGLHHFAVIASSEESISFYEKLGFVVSYIKQRSYDKIVLMDGYGIQIEMFIDPNHPRRAESPETLGLRHIAFQTTDIENTISELSSKGIEFGPISNDWKGIKYSNTSDPDGISIEIHE